MEGKGKAKEEKKEEERQREVGEERRGTNRVSVQAGGGVRSAGLGRRRGGSGQGLSLKGTGYPGDRPGQQITILHYQQQFYASVGDSP